MYFSVKNILKEFFEEKSIRRDTPQSTNILLHFISTHTNIRICIYVLV